MGFFKNIIITSLMILVITVFSSAQKNDNSGNSETIRKKSVKMTSLAFGGSGVLLTNVNDQLSIMTGGRGSATFNDRFTFGGGGWGMLKGVSLKSDETDTMRFFKFGYGGLEFGYIIYEWHHIRVGSNLLVACGAGFNETYPKSKGDFRLFPILEPSIYVQIAMGKLLWLDVGMKYRFATGTNFSYLNNHQLNGPSIYMAFLVGSCN